MVKIIDADGLVRYLDAKGAGTALDPYIPISDLSGKRLPMFQLADTVGDGTGSTNQNVNGSVTSVDFKVAPPAGKVYGIARLIASARDTGSFDSGGWGSNGGTPLTNGIQLFWKRSGVEINLTNISIKSHYDLAALCFDVSQNSWGSGDEFINFRFTFLKSGQYLMLDGDQGDELIVRINDDLTYLVNQVVSIQGYQE